MRTLIELLRRERDDNEAEFAALEVKLDAAARSEAIAIKRTHEQTLLLDQLRARLDDATAHAAQLRKDNADLRHAMRQHQHHQHASTSSSSGSHRSRRSSKRNNPTAASNANANADDSTDSGTSSSSPLVASLRARVAELESSCEKAFADLEAAQRGAVSKLQAAAQVVVRLENRVDELNQLLAERAGGPAPATPAPLPPSAVVAKSNKGGDRPDDDLSSSSSSGRRHQTVHASSPATSHRDKLKTSAPSQLSSGSAIGSSSPSIKKSKRASGAMIDSPPSSRAPVPEQAQAARGTDSPRLTDSPRVVKSPPRAVAPPLPVETPPPPPPAAAAAADTTVPTPADTAAIVDLQSMMAQLAARSAMASAAASAEMDMLNATIARSDTMLRTTEDIRAVVRGKLERKPTYSRNKALDELVKEASADVGGD
jgi:hypothetical protein